MPAEKHSTLYHPNQNPLNILIIDQEDLSRDILIALLTQYGHRPYGAGDYTEALACFASEPFDMVLLDVQANDRSCYEVIQSIRQQSKERHIPILLITIERDDHLLEQALFAGADDFICKPYDASLLLAKIHALARTLHLYDMIYRQRQDLVHYHEATQAEHAAAMHIWDRLLGYGELNLLGLRHHLSPVSQFNGDVLVVSQTPKGITHLMLADMTGHGLAAAIAVLLLCQVFYTYSEQEEPLSRILYRINESLQRFLPIQYFGCGLALSWDPKQSQLSFWNGGMPAACITRSAQGIIHELTSQHLPLGIQTLDEKEFMLETMILDIEDRVYLYSDGFTDAESEQGEQLDPTTLQNWVKSAALEPDGFGYLLESFSRFCGTRPQMDDVCLLEWLPKK